MFCFNWFFFWLDVICLFKHYFNDNNVKANNISYFCGALSRISNTLWCLLIYFWDDNIISSLHTFLYYFQNQWYTAPASLSNPCPISSWIVAARINVYAYTYITKYNFLWLYGTWINVFTVAHMSHVNPLPENTQMICHFSF